jgi:hypothetical protein
MTAFAEAMAMTTTLTRVIRYEDAAFFGNWKEMPNANLCV